MTAPVALSPSIPALRAEFGPAIERHLVSCGDTIVYVSRARSHDVLAWLKDAPDQRFDYLADVTAVEYRDPEPPLEVVYQLRSLARRARGRRPSGPRAAPTGWSARCTTCSVSSSPVTPTSGAS